MDITARRMMLFAVAALYVFLIFFGSVAGSGLWDRVDGAMYGGARYLLTAFYYLAGAFSLVWLVFIRKERVLANYFTFLFLAAAYAFLFANARHPDERIHLAEFGFLAVVLYYTMKKAAGLSGDKLYTYAAIAASAVGILDELVQRFVPGRYCDWQDIAMNVLSSLLGLVAVRLYLSPSKKLYNL